MPARSALFSHCFSWSFHCGGSNTVVVCFLRTTTPGPIPIRRSFRELVGSRLGGIELPESVTDLHLVHDGGKDPTHWISVRVAPADLESLKRQILEQAPLLDHVPAPLPRRVPEFIQSWWNPPTTNLSVYGLWKIYLDHSGSSTILGL